VRRLVAHLEPLWEMIYAPGRAFARSAARSGYVVPLAALGLLGALLSAAQGPLQLEWAGRYMLRAGTPPEQAVATIGLMRQCNLAVIALAPALLLLRWLLHSLPLWLTSRLTPERIAFSRVLTIVGYSYVPVLLRDVVICVALLLRGSGMLAQPGGMQVSLGLNLLLPRLPAPWMLLAGNINPFEVWFVALLAVGFAGETGRRWRAGLAIVLPAWISITLAQMALAYLGMSAQAQLGLG
jgi:hypothetical protein